MTKKTQLPSRIFWSAITSVGCVFAVLQIFSFYGCQSPFPKYSVELKQDIFRCIFIDNEDASTIIGKTPTIEQARKNFFLFCAAPHGRQDRSIQTLYLSPYLNSEDFRCLERHADDFAQFLREAHYHGFKVKYLATISGTSSLNEQTLALQELDMLINFNASQSPEERWDGIHYNFEPSQLSTWKTNAESIWANSTGFFQQARTKINNQSQQAPFTMGFSIPASINPEHLNDALDAIDYVGIVSYNDRTPSITQEIAPLLDKVKSHDKKAWILTQSIQPDAELNIASANTFATEGHQFLEATIDQLFANLHSHTALQGFGYYRYQPYHFLKAEGDIVRKPTYTIDINNAIARCSFIRISPSFQVIGLTPSIQENRKALFQFSARPHDRLDRSVQTLYIAPFAGNQQAGHQELLKQPEKFAQFLREAHYLGFKVIYLSSTRGQGIDTDKTLSIQELKAVLAYNNARPKEEHWDGIHYDIAIYTTPEGSDSPDSSWAHVHSLLEGARAVIDTHNFDNTSNFNLGLSIPSLHLPGNFSAYLDIIDTLGIISHKDRASLIVQEIIPILNKAKRHNIKSWVILQSKPPHPEAGVTNASTFAGEGHQFLENTLDQVYADLSSHHAFKGLGYHEFQTYRDLEERGYLTRPPSYSIKLNHDIPRCSFFWIEDSKKLIGMDPVIQENRKKAFQFCAQPHNDPTRSIQKLYVSPYLEHPQGNYRYLERHPEDFAQFLREAHHHGFTVEYLSSIGGLISNAEKEVTHKELDMVLAYNASRPPEERWDGIHYDIEPHTFEEWKIEPETIWARNRTFFQEARNKINNYLASKPSAFKMGLSVPTFHTEERLNDIFESMDYIGIMSYHDRSGTIIGASRRILDIAQTHHKNAWIFTESMPPSERWGVARSNSFSEEGHIFLEATLDQVYEEFRTHPGFKGFGYHEFKTFRTLKAEGYVIRNQQTFGGIINNFNQSEHDLEGKVIAYAKPPSFISSSLEKVNNEDETNSCLRLAYSKQPNSWCGWVTVLAADGNFIDASEYSHITFKVRGSEGGETFTVGLADKKWYGLDDSVQSKDIASYLPGEVTTNWQNVRIPFNHFPDIKFMELASVGIHFNNRQSMSGAIFIDNLHIE